MNRWKSFPLLFSFLLNSPFFFTPLPASTHFHIEIFSLKLNYKWDLIALQTFDNWSRLADANRYLQLLSNYRLISNHRFSSIGHRGKQRRVERKYRVKFPNALDFFYSKRKKKIKFWLGRTSQRLISMFWSVCLSAYWIKAYSSSDSFSLLYENAAK